MLLLLVLLLVLVLLLPLLLLLLLSAAAMVNCKCVDSTVLEMRRAWGPLTQSVKDRSHECYIPWDLGSLDGGCKGPIACCICSSRRWRSGHFGTLCSSNGKSAH
jgi:hypothetical protein